MTDKEEMGIRALSADPNLKRLEDLLGEFNLFVLLQIWQKELQHSWLIAWLLDPSGSHGLGDAFLRAFLAQATAAAEELGISVPSPSDGAQWRFADIEVARERHYIDILVLSESESLACIIENKIFSDEIPDQLRSYLDTVRATYPQLSPFPIFLTPDARRPLTERDQANYISLGYAQVADIIDTLLHTHGSDVGAPVRSFLEQYVRLLRRHIVKTPSDIDELAMEVYTKHREAIERIIAAKSRAFDWSLVDDAVQAHAPLLKPDNHSRSYRRFFAPALDEIPDLWEGDYWTGSGRELLFEFRNYETLWLDLVVGPCGDDTRKRLHNIGRERGQPFRSPSSKQKFQYIYRRPILQKREGAWFDAENARPEIERALGEFFEHDFWPLVNAIREEFGLPLASREAIQP